MQPFNVKYHHSDFFLGFIYSSIVVIFWGMLPIALKLAFIFIDAVTLTWIRFAIALLIMLIIQAALGNLLIFKRLNKRDWLILFAASFFLVINYITFVLSLQYLHPGVAQLNFQSAPFYLAIGGVFFHKDKVRLQQWLCFATLAIGMLIFFHPHLNFEQSDKASTIMIGAIIVQLSAMAWSIYALLQKSMISKISPANTMLSIYFFGVFIMMPFTDFKLLSNLSLANWWVIAFCAVNTLVAYGAFAQAMKHWQTVQVSAMIVLTPIASFLLAELCVAMLWWPEIVHSANLDWLSIIGIAIVLTSAITVQFMSKPIDKISERTITPIKALS